MQQLSNATRGSGVFFRSPPEEQANILGPEGYLKPMDYIDGFIKDVAVRAESAARERVGDNYGGLVREYNGQGVIRAVSEALKHEHERLRGGLTDGHDRIAEMPPAYRAHVVDMLLLERIVIDKVLAKPCPPSDRVVADGLIQHGSLRACYKATSSPLFDVPVAAR